MTRLRGDHPLVVSAVSALSTDAVRRASAGADAITKPCSPEICAPILASPETCMSSPREPIMSPPGRATRTYPRRASSGPAT